MNTHVRERRTELAIVRLATILTRSEFRNEHGASAIWVPADLRRDFEELAFELEDESGWSEAKSRAYWRRRGVRRGAVAS